MLTQRYTKLSDIYMYIVSSFFLFKYAEIINNWDVY